MGSWKVLDFFVSKRVGTLTNIVIVSVVFMSPGSSCSGSRGHITISKCCYSSRGSTAAAAGSTGAVINPARGRRSPPSYQRHTATADQHDGTTNHTGLADATGHTQWSAVDFGRCAGHLRSSVESGAQWSCC